MFVAELSSATTVAESNVAIDQIARYATDAANRLAVRKALLTSSLGVSGTVWPVLDGSGSNDSARRLAAALFGRKFEDLSAGWQHAAMLIQGPSTTLAQCLGEVGAEQERRVGEVVKTAERRLGKQQVAIRRVRTTENTVRRRPDRRIGWVAALAAVALLGVAVLGVLVLSGRNDTADRLGTIQRSVDGLPRGFLGAASLPTFPWVVTAQTQVNDRVALVVLERDDGKYRGAECQQVSPPAPPSPSVWQCNGPPLVNNPGTTMIIAWSSGKLPNLGVPIPVEEIERGAVLFSQG